MSLCFLVLCVVPPWCVESVGFADCTVSVGCTVFAAGVFAAGVVVPGQSGAGLTEPVVADSVTAGVGEVVTGLDASWAGIVAELVAELVAAGVGVAVPCVPSDGLADVSGVFSTLAPVAPHGLALDVPLAGADAGADVVGVGVGLTLGDGDTLGLMLGDGESVADRPALPESAGVGLRVGLALLVGVAVIVAVAEPDGVELAGTHDGLGDGRCLDVVLALLLGLAPPAMPCALPGLAAAAPVGRGTPEPATPPAPVPPELLPVV
jgi:hypothetical protein